MHRPICSTCSLRAPAIPAAVKRWRCQRCGSLHNRGSYRKQIAVNSTSPRC
jgi:ribosomal protein L37AE/L43A